MLPATCSVTRKRLNIKHLAKNIVGVFVTLKVAILLSISALRAAPNVCRAHLPSIIFTLLPVTPRSHQSLHTPTNHSTLASVTPGSHLPLHARICHSPASPLSPLHAHCRYPHAHIEAQSELGTRLVTTGFRRYKAFWRTSSRMFPSSSL